jgi:predicted transcriptional regulator of viral defense system
MTENKQKTYKKGLSSYERRVLTTLSNNNLSFFTTLDLGRILGADKNVYDLIYHLKKKGWIKKIEKGKYVLTDISGIPYLDVYEIATKLLWPSYISFWTALSYHHLTEQIPQTIFIATTRSKKNLQINKTTIKFIKISPKRFFGYTKIKQTLVADIEKSILDSLLFPRYAGGLSEIIKCLKEGREKISISKLINYAEQMGNKSLMMILGFLLDYLGYTFPEKNLLKHRPKAYPLLDVAGEPRGKLDKKWHLILNVSLEEVV